MHFSTLAISTLAAFAAAETLPEALNEFPPCSLGCLNEKIKDEKCDVTNFQCICDAQVQLAIKLGGCVHDACTAGSNSFDAGEALGDFCARWHDNPPATEVAAATSSISGAIANASTATGAAATSTSTSGASAVAGSEPAVKIAGVMAAVGALLL